MSHERLPLDRVNLDGLSLAATRAHGGEGEIRHARIAGTAALSGACHFIDLAVLPPGTSIGRHRHAETEEEFYLVLEGRGRMSRGASVFPVRAGDLIRNPPGGEHGLSNTGDDDLKIFVFEVGVP